MWVRGGVCFSEGDLELSAGVVHHDGVDDVGRYFEKCGHHFLRRYLLPNASRMKLLTLLPLLFFLVVDVVGYCGDGQKGLGLASCHLGPASCFHQLFESVKIPVGMSSSLRSKKTSSTSVCDVTCSEDCVDFLTFDVSHKGLFIGIQSLASP